jgi:hypothetical protein
MNTNERHSSLDRTLGANKPVDPATRLSELLAQSLEELTRPFDPAHPPPARDTAQPQRLAEPPPPEQTPEESRIDADKQVDRETPAETAEVPGEHAEEPVAAPESGHAQEPIAAATETADQPDAVAAVDTERAADTPNAAEIVAAPLVPETAPPQGEGAAAAVIARVRKLMLVSMAVTILAVGSVFGFIGYRIFKGEGTTAKTADKLPPASAIPTDITLSLPRAARVIQAAVAADRLVITLEADGKVEVRTFDVKTLQPAGRINFSGTP